jgi:hypothetical protein
MIANITLTKLAVFLLNHKVKDTAKQCLLLSQLRNSGAGLRPEFDLISYQQEIHHLCSE